MATTTTPFFADTTGYAAMERLLATQYNAVVSDMDSIRASRAALNLAGSGNYTAVAAEYEPVVLECSGLLTGNRSLLLPLVAGARWLVRNATTGSYTLTVKGATGSGIAITQGGTAWVWTDGVDFFRGTPDVEQDGDLSAGTVPASAIEDGSLTGTQVANTAAANVIGGLPVVHIVSVPAGATGDVDVVLTHKTRVLDVHLVKTTAAGGGAGTIQVKNGANAISDAMSINVADQTVVRAATLDDAQHTISAGGTLRVTRTRTASTDESCEVYVTGVRVA